MPGLTTVAAEVGREDPAEAFAAVAALLYALSPLVAFAIARLALGWSQRLSLVGALVFRLALDERRGQPRLPILGGLLIAGALGIYRLPFIPYVAFLLAAVTAGFLVTYRNDLAAAAKIAADRLARLVAAAALLALPSIIAVARYGDNFWSRQGATASWNHYLRALPSDAIGLVPRLPTLDYGVPLAWRLFAVVVAAAVLADGFNAVRRSDGGCRDLVTALFVGSILALGVALLPEFTPYYSIKLMAYGCVPFTLTALAPLSRRRLPPTLAVAGSSP